MSTNTNSVSFYIKTHRTHSMIRKYAWTVTLLIGIGGQFIPQIGLLVPFIMAALILMSLFKGKYWCGNFCPHGSFFDQLILPYSRNKKIPGVLRSTPVIAAVLIFFMFNMGSRLFTVFQNLGAAPLDVQLGSIFANTYLMVLIAGGLLGLFVNTRTWCQFCPMGTMETIAYKVGKGLGLTKKYDEKVTITDPALCHSCAKCARVCPMQLTPYLSFSENNQLEDERCIRCYTCVNNCPAGILHMATEEEAQEIASNASLDGYEDAQYYQAEIKSIQTLKDDVREYTFKLLEPTTMSYTPGQFVILRIDAELDMYRAYSIASASADGSEISVTVKKLADGYGTNILFQNFQEGDKVTLKGPMGRDLRISEAEVSQNDVLLIANGIGVTPFISTVEYFFEHRQKETLQATGTNGDTASSSSGTMTLLYGVRHEEDLVYDGYLENVAEKNSDFNYYKILSRPHSDNYRKGYVTDILEELSLNRHTKVYICGTEKMADHSIKLLKEKGIADENISYESFGL